MLDWFSLQWLQEYADDNEAFFRDWVPQFQEMSLLGRACFLDPPLSPCQCSALRVLWVAGNVAVDASCSCDSCMVSLCMPESESARSCS